MLGVSQLSENHLNHPNLVTMFHYSKSVFSLYHIYFEGYELKLYLNRKLPRVIIDGLKISNDFEIQHFDFWVEFHLEGFPEEARRRNKEKEENKEVDEINTNDDWKLFKDFAKNAVGDKAEYDLLRR